MVLVADLDEAVGFVRMSCGSCVVEGLAVVIVLTGKTLAVAEELERDEGPEHQEPPSQLLRTTTL